MANAVADSSEVVIHKLIECIRRDGLTTGDRLPSIRQLARTLGVGPNAVRDALLRAQTMGLVQIHPRAGVFVQSPDFSPLVDALSGTLDTALSREDHNLFHLVEARRVIEVYLVGEAAARRRSEDLLPLRQALQAMAESGDDRAAFIEADERFHLGIAQIVGNMVLLTMLRAVLTLQRPYRLQLLSTPARRDSNARRHEEIYRSLLDGDVERACAAMREHGAYHHQALIDWLAADVEPEEAAPVGD